MTIAITGATGQLGRLVIDRLKQRAPDTDIVALARSPKADLPIGIREFDYDRPETLRPALEGVDSLLLISGSEIGRRIPQHRAVIEAARQAGVRRIVYTSILNADDNIMSLAAEHRETEALLKASGLRITLLRNGWYTENYVSGIQAAQATGALIGSEGEGRIASASRADYAEAAVTVLLGEGHDGKVYELAGGPAFTMAEMAAEISRQTGRDIPFVNLPANEYAAALIQAGLPEGLAQMLAQFSADTASGTLDGSDETLRGLIGRPATPMAQTITDALA